MTNESDNLNSVEDSHCIDELVRRQLESDAESLSVERLRSRVMLSLTDGDVFPVESGSKSSPQVALEIPVYQRWWSKSAAVVIAAGLLIAAFLAGQFDNEAYAHPADVVRAAIETHADPLERVYVVSIRKGGPEPPEFAVMKDVRVHVMGDQFWVEMNRRDRNWVWGRDKEGSVWLVAPNGHAMTIESNEIGPVLENICTVYSLNTESLLQDVLSNCRLERSDSGDSIHRILVTPRRTQNNGIRSATLDIDRETKAIRHLTIDRVRPARWASTVEFTLVGSSLADVSKYSAAGHVSNTGDVMTRQSRMDRRRELLGNWLGMTPDQWILPK